MVPKKAVLAPFFSWVQLLKDPLGWLLSSQLPFSLWTLFSEMPLSSLRPIDVWAFYLP
jgi:hypothetical protein